MTHWADKYRMADTTTFDGKLYLAACYVTCRPGTEVEHEATCRAIAQIAHNTTEHVNIWHATAVHFGTVPTCCCVVCVQARTATGR